MVAHAAARGDAFRRQAGFVTANPALQALFGEASDVAARDCPVLIVGESGTGKVMFAKGIHGASARRDRPFQTLSCHGSSRAVDNELARCLNRAGGGTLAIDGIAGAPVSVQDTLYEMIAAGTEGAAASAISARRDMRVIALTNPNATPDIATAAVEGAFRRDLSDALAEVTLTIPPLRTHPEDIPILVEHFLHRLSSQWSRNAPSIEPETMGLLSSHDWPGNVRDLYFAVEYALSKCRGPELLPEHLPSAIAS